MYIEFLFLLAAVIVLLGLPGLIFNALFHKNKIEFECIPIIGMLLLAFIGLVSWIIDKRFVGGFGVLAQVGYAMMLVILLYVYSVDKYKPVLLSNDKWVLAVLLCVLVQAVSIGINPLPIGQEYGLGSSMPGRMIASPPDHAIPFYTAKYFREHLDGNERSNEYFGIWGLGARGPLVPLGINALFTLFHARDNYLPLNVSWPLGVEGEHFAKAYGWVLNSLVILGVYSVIKSLRVSREILTTALTWVALSPVITINVVFTWPKMLATYFILLGISCLIRQRFIWGGVMMAFAWLSHPVGAIFLPAILVFAFLTMKNKPLRLIGNRMAKIIFSTSLVVSPWFFYKIFYLQNPDPFVHYVMGGGMGLEPAHNLSSWIQVRVFNVWYTLIPFAFFFSDFMQSWVYGPLNDILRWYTQYAKELPGQLGFSCFLPAYVAFVVYRRTAISKAILALIVIAFLVMDIFWGYSSDGLGRNSLEPLSIIIILFATVYYKGSRKWLYIMLPVLAIEGQMLVLSGFLFEGGVLSGVNLADGLYLFFMSAASNVALLGMFYFEKTYRLVEGES